MVNPANIEAAKKLIDKYESLTMKDVLGKTPETITGYGRRTMCLLCQTANTDCHDCIYFETSKTEQSCCHDEHKETFNAIDTAKTPEARLRAYYDRAQHIREVLEELETKGNLLPEPIEVTIKLSTKEEAQALYAVMSYYHNWELLGEKIANGVCKRLEGFQTEYNQGVIANGVTYENFFKPKLT